MDSRDIEDLFRPVARVEVRRMFGGSGVFVDGLMVAIVVQGSLYMKAVPGAGAQRFAEAGSQPFTYMRAGREAALGYWTLPESAFEDPDEFRQWYGLSWAAAQGTASAKAAKGAGRGKGKPRATSRRGPG